MTRLLLLQVLTLERTKYGTENHILAEMPRAGQNAVEQQRRISM